MAKVISRNRARELSESNRLFTGGPYEALAKDELLAAASKSYWLELSMDEKHSYPIGHIHNVQDETGHCILSFYCRDINNNKFRGQVERGGVTTFIQQ